MENESKILLIAIVILIIAIISFNSDSPTGFSVQNSDSIIKISPKVANAGDTIYITVYPGANGVNNNLNLYTAEDDLRKASVELCKSDYKCTSESTVSYWIPDTWKPGVYYVKVYDYDRKGFIIEDFTIMRGES